MGTASQDDPRFVALERKLRARIRQLKSVVVALSGGVDSSVVTAIAASELRGKALAATGVSKSLARSELDAVVALCKSLDIEHVAVDTDELSVEGYVENSPERCYFCKNELYATLSRLRRERHLAHLVDGTSGEDLLAHRPGKRAASEHGVVSPLVDIGACKADVRELARRMDLAVAERPASPCLSSRIAYGLHITPERLERVAQAEEFLKSLGFTNLRVRLHDAIARIEVPPDDLRRAVEHAAAITERLRALGFVYVTLDLAGLRSGSLLEVVRSP